MALWRMGVRKKGKQAADNGARRPRTAPACSPSASPGFEPDRARTNAERRQQTSESARTQTVAGLAPTRPGSLPT